jgi:hypothetical protein
MEKKIQKSKIPKREPLSDKIKDSKLKEIFLFLTSKKIINEDKISLNGDLEANIRQDIEESIKDKYNTLNERFSEIRKSGKDLGVLNFKLMMLPLKIKVFLSTYEKKDAENIVKRIEDIEKEISFIKK